MVSEKHYIIGQFFLSNFNVFILIIIFTTICSQMKEIFIGLETTGLPDLGPDSLFN